MAKKNIELVQFKLDSNRVAGIEVLMGDNFRYFKNEFCFNTSPYSNAILVPIFNVKIDDYYFVFDYLKRTKIYHNKIDLSKHEMAMHLAEYILKVYTNRNLILDSANDKINLKCDINEKYFDLSIENAESTRWINITLSKKYGNSFTLISPSPSKKMKLEECVIVGNMFHIKTDGMDIWNENRKDNNTSFTWYFNLQSDIFYLVKNLIEIGMKIILSLST